MKKMLLIIGLLVLSVLVFGCTQGGTLAGEAISSKSLVVKGDLISLNEELLEYMGADRDTTPNPKIRFKKWYSGETVDYSIVSGRASIVAWTEGSLPPPGIFNVQLTNPRIIDSPLMVDYNGDNVLDRYHQLTSLHFTSPGLAVQQCPSAIPTGLQCGNVLTLLEGESIRTTALDNNGISGEHDLFLSFINSSSVRLTVDGASSGTIHNRQSAVANNVMITAWYVLYQDYAGGMHSVTLCVSE